MHQHYGYRLMHGKGKESGLVRCAEGAFFVQCRFLFPGNTYTLYRSSTKEAEKTADVNGCLSFSCENDGFFFLCGEKETPILWEETESNTGAFLARQLLQKGKPLPLPEEKKASPAPHTPPPASAPPFRYAAPQRNKCRALSAAAKGALYFASPFICAHGRCPSPAFLAAFPAKSACAFRPERPLHALSPARLPLHKAACPRPGHSFLCNRLQGAKKQGHLPFVCPSRPAGKAS